MPRAALRLIVGACDNHCIFCAQEGLAPAALSEADLPVRLAALRDGGADELTFTGGEPLLVPWLPAAVAAARAAGFRAIGVQTNGRRVTDRMGELAAAGLTDVHLSIHGAEARVHDYHTGVPGSFAQALAAVAAARGRGLTVVVTSLLTRSSFRTIGALPWLLQSRGVAAWTIAVPRSAGRAAASFDRVVPRLGLAVPFALHALEQARKLGLPAWIAGAPRCLLGPFADRALPIAEPMSAAAMSFAPPCETCPARASTCAGVDATYLARFGHEELSPAPAAPSVTHALARLFVGPGELAPPTPRAIPEPPARARLALPVIGKVVPAAAEVAASTPRRSGEALREIFPDLFVEKAK